MSLSAKKAHEKTFSQPLYPLEINKSRMKQTLEVHVRFWGGGVKINKLNWNKQPQHGHPPLVCLTVREACGSHSSVFISLADVRGSVGCTWVLKAGLWPPCGSTNLPESFEGGGWDSVYAGISLVPMLAWKEAPTGREKLGCRVQGLSYNRLRSYFCEFQSAEAYVLLVNQFWGTLLWNMVFYSADSFCLFFWGFSIFCLQSCLRLAN